jgi:hypothetical protein
MVIATNDWKHQNTASQDLPNRQTPAKMVDTKKSNQIIQFLASLDVITDIRLTKATVDVQRTRNGQEYPELYLLLHADKIRSLNVTVMKTLQNLCVNDDQSIDEIVADFMMRLCLDEENMPETLTRDLTQFCHDMIEDYHDNRNGISDEETLLFLSLTTAKLYDVAITYSQEKGYFCPVENNIAVSMRKYIERSICSKLQKDHQASAVIADCMQSQNTLPRIQSIFDTLQQGIQNMALICTGMYQQLDAFNPFHHNAREQVDFFMVVLSDVHNEIKAMNARGLLPLSTEEISNQIVIALSETDEAHQEDFVPPTLDDHTIILGFINNFMQDALAAQPNIKISPTSQALQNQAFTQILNFYDLAKANEKSQKSSKHLSRSPNKPTVA